MKIAILILFIETLLGCNQNTQSDNSAEKQLGTHKQTESKILQNHETQHLQQQPSNLRHIIPHIPDPSETPPKEEK